MKFPFAFHPVKSKAVCTLQNHKIKVYDMYIMKD